MLFVVTHCNVSTHSHELQGKQEIRDLVSQSDALFYIGRGFFSFSDKKTQLEAEKSNEVKKGVQA